MVLRQDVGAGSQIALPQIGANPPFQVGIRRVGQCCQGRLKIGDGGQRLLLRIARPAHGVQAFRQRPPLAGQLRLRTPRFGQTLHGVKIAAHLRQARQFMQRRRLQSRVSQLPAQCQRFGCGRYTGGERPCASIKIGGHH